MNKNLELEALSYEQAFNELQVVIDQLETGDKPLEETLDLYELGQTLYRHCTTLLEQAELKVQQLNADGTTEDFED